jgi:general secretion pathway protein F
MLLRSGETLDGALSALINASHVVSIKDVLENLRTQLREGRTLSQAMSTHDHLFSELYVNIVNIGEANGNLPEAFEHISDYLERQSALAESIKSALTYPIILLLVSGLSVVVLFAFVLPTFRSMFDNIGATLPDSTRILLQIGDLSRNYGWIILIVGIAIIAYARTRLTSTPTLLRWHRFVLRIPLVGDMIQRLDVSRFSRSLATLLNGGIPLVDALRLSQAAISNRYLRSSVEKMIQDVKEGRRLSHALLNDAFFPPLAAHMVQVGEKSGDLARALDYVALEYDRAFESMMKRMVAILEPALIIAIGAIIALVIFAIVSAMQSLNALPV